MDHLDSNRTSVVLEKIFETAKKSVPASKLANEFCKEYCLNASLSNLGILKKDFYYLLDEETLNVLKDLQVIQSYNNKKSSPVRESIIFPLRDHEGKITGIYAINAKDKQTSYQFGNGSFYQIVDGSKSLIVAASMIEAISLIQFPFIRNEYSVLCALSESDLSLIGSMKDVEQVILFLQNEITIESYQHEIQKNFPSVQICKSELEIVDSANAFLQKNETERLKSLISFEIEKPMQELAKIIDSQAFIQVKGEFDTSNPQQIIYKTDNAEYHVYNLSMADFAMAAGVSINHLIYPNVSYRISKLDFFSNDQIRKESIKASKILIIDHKYVEAELNQLYHELNQYRKSNSKKSFQKAITYVLNEARRNECKAFLKEPNLKERLQEKIAASGIIGEPLLSLFLFLIGISHKFRGLHARILGTQSMGKSRLLKGILDLMPTESILPFNRITSAALFNMKSSDLDGKIIGVEDKRGIEDKANYFIQDLQSGKTITSVSSVKSEFEGYTHKIQTIEANIATIICGTSGASTWDESSRAYDKIPNESDLQTQAIINYQNQIEAGIINKDDEEKEKAFLRDCVRVLEKHEVVNPFAGKIQLPIEIKTRRRLNQMFLDLTRQITLLFQYQRKKDAEGRLITELDDVDLAIDLLFDSIALKADPLDDPTLRSFFEEVKGFVKSVEGKKYKDHKFKAGQLLGKVSKGRTAMYELLSELVRCDYLIHTSNQYQVAQWDDNGEFVKKIQTYLKDQVKNLKSESGVRTENGQFADDLRTKSAGKFIVNQRKR